MKDFSKYLTASSDDKDFGIFLNCAGKSIIKPESDYPSKEHPTGYYFNWNSGRIFNECLLIYITAGSGVYETNDGVFNIKTGTIIITTPGVWHRYKPNYNTGWHENYIGFEGVIANQLIQKTIQQTKQHIIYCGIREELIDTFYKIFELVQNERPGFQQISSGLIIKLMGYLIAFEKQRFFDGKYIEKLIQKLRFKMRENIEAEIDIKSLAENNNLSYAYFRKMFKKYSGTSPYSYHIDLKIMRAKELLLTSNKSIKEISFELGFDSIHYFSRLFKKRTGQAPSKIRK